LRIRTEFAFEIIITLLKESVMFAHWAED